MKNLFSKVLSIMLTVAIMLTLVPSTLALAETAPAYTLSIVDGDGNAVTSLEPGDSAYVRIGVSGIEQVYSMAAGITATNATFDTNLTNLKKRFAETGILGELFEINNEMMGAVVTTDTAKFKLTKISSVSATLLPVATTGFVLVDVPFTVPAGTAIGTAVSFDILTSSNDTNFFAVQAAAKKYTVGHSTRPVIVNGVTMTVAAPVVETNNVQLVAPTGLTVAEEQADEASAIVAAEELVKETANMFYTVLSDGSVSETPATDVYATAVTSEYAEGVVTVTITAVSGGKTLVGAATVEVAVTIVPPVTETNDVQLVAPSLTIAEEQADEAAAIAAAEELVKSTADMFRAVLSDGSVAGTPAADVYATAVTGTYADGVVTVTINAVTEGKILVGTANTVEVAVTIVPPVTETNNVQFVAPTGLTVAEAQADEASAIVAAEELVKSTDGMFYTVLSDGTVAGTPAAGIYATEVISTYADGVVTVTITAVTEGKTLVGANTVEVAVTVEIPAPSITGATPFKKDVKRDYDFETEETSGGWPTVEIAGRGKVYQHESAERTLQSSAAPAGTEAVVIETDIAIIPDADGNAVAEGAGLILIYYGNVGSSTWKCLLGRKANGNFTFLTYDSGIPFEVGRWYHITIDNRLKPDMGTLTVVDDAGVTYTYSRTSLYDTFRRAKFAPEASSTDNAYETEKPCVYYDNFKFWYNQPVTEAESYEISAGEEMPELKSDLFCATLSTGATRYYEVVHDAPAEGKAYIDISSFDGNVVGTYTFDAVITDSTISNAPYVIEDVLTVEVKIPSITDVEYYYKGTHTVARGEDFFDPSINTVTAILDVDNDNDGEYDTREYEVVTDAPAEGKAYIDVSAYDNYTEGTYTFDIVITDSNNKEPVFTKENILTIIVGPAESIGKIVANPDKVVEVKYGSLSSAIASAIAARDDLFCEVMTDGTLVGATYTAYSTPSTAYYDMSSFSSTSVGTEQYVTVKSVSGATVLDGATNVKVKVLPVTIESIGLTSAWIEKPEKPEGTDFPGFGTVKIKAELDPDTSSTTSISFEIVTDAPTEGKAYVDTSAYNAAAMGSYILPVVIVSPAIGGTYEGTITLTVGAPETTNNVRLTTSNLALSGAEGSIADIITAAENLVKSTDGLFSTVLTNDATGEVASGVYATTVIGQHIEDNNFIRVGVLAVSEGKTLVGNIVISVEFSQGGSAPSTPVITGTVRVTDLTEEVIGFEGLTPMGALVTAIKVDDEGNGGNVDNGTYQAYYTTTDANGNFSLALEPGTYKIHIAHAKYEYFEGTMYASRTIHDEFEAIIKEGEDMNLGTVNLYYTFFGDTDLDGDVDGEDYGMFAPQISATIDR